VFAGRYSLLFNPLLFFVISVSLFPLAISPEATTLSQIAAGIIWVASMLAVLLSLNSKRNDEQFDCLFSTVDKIAERLEVDLKPKRRVGVRFIGKMLQICVKTDRQ
jgi:heme exporter protein CcmB